MADYWKSNPRKYCDVCKCWFGDNKASIDFHERGRRHKENAKKLLSSARQRSAENEKKEAKTNEMLASIEMAAAAAYVKDLGGEEDHPNTKKKPKLQRTASPPPQPQIEEPFLLKKARAHVEILDAIQKRQKKTEREAAKRAEESGPPPPPPSQWQQAATPEGQLYYYNMFTRETQWEQPPDFLPLPQTPPTHPPSTDTTQPTFIHAGCGAGGEDEERGRKRSLAEEQSEPDKRPTGPYGAWTTVTLHPRQPVTETETERAAEEESSDDGDGDSEEERADKDEEEKLSFKERTLNAPESDEGEVGGVTVGNFKGFGFKKRSTAARPQIRQRTSELS